MLTLSLLRHAKSSWDAPTLDDFERPLNARGRKAAPRMGAWLADADLCPDLVVSSTSVRTRETLALLLPALPAPPPVDYSDELYLAAAETLLARARDTPGKTRHLLLVGHNPGLHDLANLLIGEGEVAARGELARKLPTCALVSIAFRARSWRRIGPGGGMLLTFMTPRKLEAVGR